MKYDPNRIHDIIRWLETSEGRIIPASKNEVFDIGCQICDDVKNDNFKNAFLIYMNDGKTLMATNFENENKARYYIEKLYNKLSKNMAELLDKYSK
jgi:hypothetical protein